MEEERIFAHERATEDHVRNLLKNQSEAQPISDILEAFDAYRQASFTATFLDFVHAQEHQARLWQAHTEGRSYFKKTLVGYRKQGRDYVVAARQFADYYKKWIKGGELFYRRYILQLHVEFSGIKELEAVAHKVGKNAVGSTDESSQNTSFTKEQREFVLQACHQVLIYLGDLSRYRAADQLDSEQKWGAAKGYYELAHAIMPTSGLGQHQQAVVALARNAHFAAIYHLYRSILAEHPHPAAANNLALEFNKIDSAWKHSALIPKTAPNDEDAPKLILTGWFVRMHSLCARGEVFSSHKELEQELLGQFGRILMEDSERYESSVMRMVMTNLAAQYHAGLLFQAKQGQNSEKEQQAFYYFFRFNLKTFTILLSTFDANFRALSKATAEDEDLAAKLTPAMRRLLPALRLYSSWLLCNIHLVSGLSADEFVGPSITELWKAYARVIGVFADDDFFGVWALDDYDVPYMLEEDADTIAFSPLQNAQQTSWRNWHCTSSAASGVKAKYFDAGVVRLSQDEEMLARVKGLLEDGSYLANDVTEAPLGIVGDRIYHGLALQDALAAHEEARLNPPPLPKPKPAPPPLSYAAAAKSGRAVGSGRPTANGAAATNGRSRQAQATRMVDDLVGTEEDEGNNPVTPPQQHIAHPAVVPNGVNGVIGDDFYHPTSNGNVNGTYASHATFADVTSFQQPKQPSTVPTPPTIRTPRQDHGATIARERMASVSKLWDQGLTSPTSTTKSPSVFPSGLPAGTLGSPADFRANGGGRMNNHSRVGSSNSIRSRTSLGGGEAVNGYASPLLFGAGGGIWSTGGGPVSPMGGGMGGHGG